ncbi:MAG: threonylcarbamoyl-AMP synthase [Micrococcales bacterium 73-15]|uniref:L-threonylcarbamoyladenylate synthase n=1 Tax=Salana multivorans TaxID=120377 RepID=UPI0009632203|nr:MAG: threonylcarbamoyl-AMP synthase [Micrococcales bacterium 73-15]
MGDVTVLPCDPDQLDASLEVAAATVRGGGLVVLPTDTVYGIGADAFDASAVAALLAAKGRGRQMPPPVLVGGPEMLDVLGLDVPQPARALAERFWPGALTLIVRCQPTLDWDLGDTGGTVALRMPDDEVALALLRRTGPLAVSSANRTGQPAATSATDARDQLGARVAVYLDAGDSAGGVPSTIVDARTSRLAIVRSGAIDAATLATVVPHLAAEVDDTGPSAETEAEPA